MQEDGPQSWLSVSIRLAPLSPNARNALAGGWARRLLKMVQYWSVPGSRFGTVG